MIYLDLNQIAETPGSALIPEHLKELFEKKTKEYEGIRIYFEYLLNRYEQISNEVRPKCPSPKCEYQEKNQKLRKYSFRPVNQDWTRLGLLADYLRLSKTNLFVFLMLLDVMKWWKVMKKLPLNQFVGIPSNHNRIKFQQTFFFQKKYKNYSRYLQFY